MKPKLILGLALVLSLLAALHHYNLFPFHHRPRSTSSYPACYNNLVEINNAVNQWALEHGKHAGDPVTLDEVKPYIIHVDRRGTYPKCLDGGTYSVTVVGAAPTCSLGTVSIKRSIHDYFYGEDSPSKESRRHRLR